MSCRGCSFLMIVASGCLIGSGLAQEIAPDDPAIAGDLGVWFRDAAGTFDVGSGVWADSSGNGRDAIPVGEVNVNAPRTYVAPALASVEGGAFSDGEVPSLRFEPDVEDLLRAEELNGGAGVSELTIFVAYNVDPLAAIPSQTRPVGFGSISSLQVNPGDHFNLGSDPSIRKDNGQLGAGMYSIAFPQQTTFIRTARMSPTAIDEWFNIDGTAQPAITIAGSSFTTSTDDFFLGDLRAGATGIPGVPGGNPAPSRFDIVQVVVYTAALSDAQVLGVNRWLASNLSGGSGGAGNELAITGIEVSPDRLSATLTWRSKPSRTYAIELTDRLEGDWLELVDDADSEGAETSATVATYAELEPPDEAPERIFYRVREVLP